MYVIKRNGNKEPLDIENIRKQTIPACSNLSNVSYEELELDSKLVFQDGIHTEYIQQALIKTAVSKISMDRPNWTYVAARLTLYDLYHRIKRYYGIKESGDVYSLVTLQDYLTKNTDVLSNFYTKYSNEEITHLNSLIDPKRDLLYDYPGFCLMEDMYLIKNLGYTVELPQHMHMSLSMFVMQNESKDKRLKLVEQMYNSVSKLEYVNATPINANGRAKAGGLISCLLTTVEDSLDSIMAKATEVAKGSKIGSGWGIDFSRVRSVGSAINIHSNAAGGKVPFLKIFNEIAVAVDQNRKRPGSFATYIESWDLEIFDFIDLRKTSGEERRRARDLFLSVSYTDIFFEREEVDGDWVLFDPKDVPLLTETYGEEFKKNYLNYEDLYYSNKDKFNPNTRVVKARDVLRYHIKAWTDTGMPFFFFKDTVNNLHRHKDLGIIRSANLCCEVVQPTSQDYTGVCNLGSINLAKFANRISTPKGIEELKDTVRLAVRVMDNCIDLTPYPSEESRRFQEERRSIGLGSLGIAEFLANQHINFGSLGHMELIDKVWSIIKETVYQTSEELAIEKGPCKIDPKRRNGYLTCIAPNSSSAILAGTTNGLEPVYNKIWVEENKRGAYTITAPGLNLDNMEYYKNPYEIDIFAQIDVAAVMQQHIDMAMSFNVFLDPVGLSTKKVRDVVVYAWKKKLKTLYYLRSKPPKNNIISNNGITCVGCAN